MESEVAPQLCCTYCPWVQLSLDRHAGAALPVDSLHLSQMNKVLLFIIRRLLQFSWCWPCVKPQLLSAKLIPVQCLDWISLKPLLCECAGSCNTADQALLRRTVKPEDDLPLNFFLTISHCLLSHPAVCLGFYCPSGFPAPVGRSCSEGMALLSLGASLAL